MLDAAARVMAEQGLDGLTLARVAEEMGWVPAALYRYVGSKDGLLAMMQRRAIQTVHASYRASAGALAARITTAPPRTAALAGLLDAARFYLDLPRADAESWLLIATLLGDPRPLLSDDESHRTAPLLLQFLAEVRAAFVRAEGAAALRSGDALSRTLSYWAALHGALSLEKARRIAPELPSAQQIGLESAAALLLGHGARPADVDAALRLVAEPPPRSPLKGRGSSNVKTTKPRRTAS